MKHNKSFEHGVQFAWDSTSLETAQTCPRKYKFMMIDQIKPKVTSVHLLFGGLYAKALEDYYKHRALGQSHNEALRSVVRDALIKTWDNETNLPVRFEDPKKTRANLIRTIVWYLEQFHDEGMKTYHLKNGKPAVELSFSIEVGDGYLWCGHLDRVVQDEAGHLFVMDQKTTNGTVGKRYFDAFRTSNQMSGYTFAGQAVLHSPVRGVIVDAAQIDVGATKFVRGITYRTPDQLDEWLDNTLRWINLFRHYTETETFPANFSACNHYGGCPYKEICASTPKMRDTIIKSDFETRVWDPVEQR